jgi:probable F420-dependent oxidoreductase
MKIGFVVRVRHLPELGRAPHYTEVRDMALQAEAVGFDALWLFDHLLYRTPGHPTQGTWECWTMLSALAEATQHIELGTLVLCTQFRNPALVAKMAHTLDEVSQGRFTLGVGAGARWNESEFTAFGMPFAHRLGRLAEALQILKPLLKDGQVDFAGRYYQVRNCEIMPRSPRRNGPPLLVGALGPRMLRIAARYADLWNPAAYLSTPESFVEPQANLHTACTAVGRDPTTLSVTALVALAYPDLGEPPPSPHIPTYLSGSPEELVRAMHGYAQMGVAHLMLYCAPFTATALGRLAEAIQEYRRQSTGTSGGL